MAWDWERAGQGALVGGGAGALAGPFGALGGGVIGGLIGGLAGGAEPQSYQGVHPYQYHPDTYPYSPNRGAVGGNVVTGYGGDYTTAGGMSDAELLTYLTQNPEEAQLYGLDPAQIGLMNFGTDEQIAEFMQGVRESVPPDMVTGGTKVPIYDTWSNVEGRAAYDRGQDWIGSGRRIMETGLGMQDRAPVQLGNEQIDASGENLANIGRQMGLAY